MGFDSVANSSIPSAPSNAKDFAKRKRANRSAKLKQCKLDARREQWLSQVKNKVSKEESIVGGEIHAPSMHAHNVRDQAIQILEISPRSRENDGSIHNYSDSDSFSNSPTSHTSSVVGSNVSGTNFTVSSTSSSGSSSGGSFSGNVTEEEDEEGDDGCLDDWEAIADALAATDKQEQHNSNSKFPPKHDNVIQRDSSSELVNQLDSGVDISEPKPANNRAWRQDDAFRPQTLPNLSKQHSFPMKSGGNNGCGGAAWACKNGTPAPSSCPICCEDLDFTDSSFLPCSCGFRLCLFCHKRILEEDGRCPGCRKQYDCDDIKVEGRANLGATYQLARSSSMFTRS